MTIHLAVAFLLTSNIKIWDYFPPEGCRKFDDSIVQVSVRDGVIIIDRVFVPSNPCVSSILCEIS